MGIRFKDGGDTRTGVSCWGIVRMVLRERVAVEVRSYGDVASADLLAASRAFTDASEHYGDFVPVEWPFVQALDVVLMRTPSLKTLEMRQVPTHVGIMVNEGVMLHAHRAAHSHCVKISDPAIWGRVISFHRHRALLA